MGDSEEEEEEEQGVWEAVASPSLWGAAVDTEPTMIQCKDGSCISNQRCNRAVPIFAILHIFAVHADGTFE